ncbi:MAG: ribosomal RNA small subunit methyltransferase A [Candidatus Glassbacteria bacterium]|nr:ribosomal RNA small subunit methyltransferase A [Candidatus Glassbacteria bacterium]
MSGRKKISGKHSSQPAFYRRRILGQHFLNDQAIAGRIVGSLGPLEQAHVLEIGAGRGILSCRLAEQAARFTAIELDRGLSEALARKLKDNGKVTVLQQDVLEFDLDTWAAQCGPLTPVVAGNIPYRITSDLLHKLIGCHRHLARAVLMLQEEVARKLTAEAGGKPYGMISVLAGYRAAREYLFFVGRGNFSPSPGVDSAVVRLDFKAPEVAAAADEKLFEFMVRRLFRDRRKQVQKVLRTDPGFKLNAGRIRDLAAETGIDLSCRPEELSVEQFVALAESMAGSGG